MKKLNYAFLVVSTFIFLTGLKLIPDKLRDRLGSADTYKSTTTTDFKVIIYNYMNYIGKLLTGFLSIVAVGFIIYAGFLYLTSGGDEAQMNKAKTTLTYAVIGIIVILLAYFMVTSVVNFATTGSIFK